MLGFWRKSFDEFVWEIPDIKLVAKFAERTNKIMGIEFSDITYLPYDVLKNEIPKLIKDAKYEEAIFEVVRYKEKKANLKRLRRVNNYTKFKFYLWIRDQYNGIRELEQQYLHQPPDMKLVNAGIKELDILGDTNLIDMLAQGDVLRWAEIRRLPYATIFDKQLKVVIEGKIQKRLRKKES